MRNVQMHFFLQGSKKKKPFLPVASAPWTALHDYILTFQNLHFDLRYTLFKLQKSQRAHLWVSQICNLRHPLVLFRMRTYEFLKTPRAYPPFLAVNMRLSAYWFRIVRSRSHCCDFRNSFMTSVAESHNTLNQSCWFALAYMSNSP